VFTPVRPSTQGEGGGANYRAIGRVRPGHTVVDASGEWAAIATAVIPASALPPGVTREFKAIPLQEVIVDEVRAPIELLLAVGLLVLVIACVNLPALALARSGSLRQQVAIRLALGSSRRAIVQQLVIENLILGGAGGALGVVVGTALLAGLKTLAADVYVIWAQANLDLRVVAGSIAVSTVTTAMAGLVPALRASRSSAARLIVSEDSRTVVGGPHQWWRRALVCIELALSVALLVITGLLTRTLVNLQTLDPGFEAKGLVATHVSLQDERYRTAERINQLFEQSLTDLARTPGVESAAVSLELPYHRLLNNFMRFTDREPSTTQPSMANLMYVSPSFFDTYRIPVRVGRTFADADRAGAPHVAVVNEAFVRSLADGIVPLGRRFAMGDGTEIVGVVGDVQARNSGFRWRGMVDGPLQAPPIVFLPAAQVSDGLFRLAHQWFEPYWTIRVAGVGNADAVLRRAIAKVDPLLPIQETMSLDDVRRSATASQRLLLVLVGTCAMVALLLTMIGVYGLMAQVVLERTREIAIRVSLGATIGRMIGRLTLIGATLAAVGTTVGLLLAWMNTRLVVSLLWGVDHRDPLTFAAIAVGLFMFATMASVVPALRALRIDPARTLRA
jgi:predicted permease